MDTVAIATRLCMNCGRAQDHRIHDYAGFGSLPNGCAYSFAQPKTLMDAVLWPAIREAAAAHGVDMMQAHGAIWDYGREGRR